MGGSTGDGSPFNYQGHNDMEMENIENQAAPDTTLHATLQTPIKTPAPNVTTRSSAGKRKALEPLDENLPDNKKQKPDTDPGPVTPHLEEAPSPVAGHEGWSSRLRSSAVKKEPEPEAEGPWQSREVIVILD